MNSQYFERKWLVLINPSELKDCKIQGEVGRIIDLYIYNRQISDFAKNIIYKEAEDAFRNRVDDMRANGSGTWQGEFWGKWIISAVLTAKYTGDDEYKQYIRKCALSLCETQDQDGYIGTYKEQMRVFENVQSQEWIDSINWNIWCRKYTLWGLIEAYELTKDERIINATVRFADNLINKLRENNINILETGCFAGLASGSILVPIIELYKICKDEKYLEFAKEIAENWETDKKPALISNALSDVALHQWYENPRTWAKAYEMMSCYEGILGLYKVTKEKKYLEAVIAFHQKLYDHEKNTICSVGFIDMFENGAQKINAMSEPCDAIHWNRLNFQLLCLTAQVKFADEYETTFYNAILASLDDQYKWGFKRLRSSHCHITAHGQSGLLYNHCCVNNMPRALLEAAQFALMHSGDCVFINLFENSVTNVPLGDGNNMRVCISGEYLSKGSVTIYADNQGSCDMDLRVRIPSWSKSTQIKVEEVVQEKVAEGQYFSIKVSAEKTTRIDIQFSMNPRLVYPQAKGFMEQEETQRWANYFYSPLRIKPQIVPQEGVYSEVRPTVFYGPLLLARDIRLGEQELYAKNPPCLGCSVEIDENVEGYGYVFKTVLDFGEGNKKEVRMCDFASAGKTENAETSAFSIYV